MKELFKVLPNVSLKKINLSKPKPEVGSSQNNKGASVKIFELKICFIIIFIHIVNYNCKIRIKYFTSVANDKRFFSPPLYFQQN